MALLFQMAHLLLATYTGTTLKDMVIYDNTPLRSKCSLAGMKSWSQPGASPPTRRPLDSRQGALQNQDLLPFFSHIILFHHATASPCVSVYTSSLEIWILIAANYAILDYIEHPATNPSLCLQLFYRWNSKFFPAINLCACLSHFVNWS